MYISPKLYLDGEWFLTKPATEVKTYVEKK